MKSGKQRRQEIKQKRTGKAVFLKAEREDRVVMSAKASLSTVVKADHFELAHNNTYGSLPEYYHDIVFNCIECGESSLWTAKSQKWWYEVAKGSIFSKGSRCEKCRKLRRDAKAEQKKHMAEMAKKTPHPNEKFFRPK